MYAGKKDAMLLLLVIVALAHCATAQQGLALGREPGEFLKPVNQGVPISDAVDVFAPPPPGGRSWNRGNEKTHAFIVGGVPATFGQHPYVCNLRLNVLPDQWHFLCGALLYNNKTILTAAHCVDKTFPPTTYSVFCGNIYLNTNPTIQQVSRVKTMRVHPNFVYNAAQGYPNDIALLEMETTFTYNPPYVYPYPLASPSTSLPTNCQLVGWGYTATGNVSNNLQAVNITLISNADCQKRFVGNTVTNGHVCFMNAQTADGACNGDSGGPARCGDYTIVGVSSWGAGDCSKRNRPSVYTRLSAYASFITQNAWQ